MYFKDYLIRAAKKTYSIIFQKKFELPICDTDRQSANDKIYNLLVSPNPCMMARFGTTELITINNYLCISNKSSYIKKLWHYISDKTHTPWWHEENIKFLDVYSGVFPPTIKTAEEFSKRYLKDIPSIDLLGSFQYYEKFMPLKKEVQYVHLETLYPFFVNKPWTAALKGKKVLVVHPFEETIKIQYQKRKNLFEHPDMLPDFELITLKAIQSAAGIKVPFKDWFEALKYMEDEISKIDFDVCLLGCGAYGMPLAAHVKRMGKKSIHMGGGLQLLFGIKGKRWDNANYGKEEFKMFSGMMNTPYNSLYNEYWIKPLISDTPQTAKALDDAIYW
jgi:hypothetical protein